jgi:hypothetical protein
MDQTVTDCALNTELIKHPSLETAIDSVRLCMAREISGRAFLRTRFNGILGGEIEYERERQDQQWGGPDHDDEHRRMRWLSDEWGIGKRLLNARDAAHREDLDNYERRLIQIAALAVAAVKASRRNRIPHGCIDTKPGFNND